MSDVKLISIKFTNFKSLRNFTISLQDINILVGPNNAGKSTIISALRILEVALKRARSKNAERVTLPNNSLGFGHHISLSQLSISLENVATDYNSEDSQIDFRFSNKNRLSLFFPNDGGCTLFWECEGQPITTVSRFKTAFPITIQVVPVLGPLEYRELFVNEDTIKSALNTHRASRHFRNYWHHFPDGWDLFEQMVSNSWPGMKIKPPEVKVGLRESELCMFVAENRIDREIFWSGFGFQIWCQLLTHISRASKSTVLAIDEPEIYLHPDVQRQLLSILRGLDADVLLATHSVEIIGEADPAEILLIQKGKNSAQRLRDVEGMQLALSAIGSAQNVTLAHLARTKKIVFVEGFDDFKTVRRFAKVLGKDDLSTGNDLTAFESGGFTSWEKIKSFAWGAKKTIDANLKIFAIYDRDYFCEEEIEKIRNELKNELTDAHILRHKEMENYLLNTQVLQRTLQKQIDQKAKRTGKSLSHTKTIKEYLINITEDERIDAQSQYVAKRINFNKSSGIDPSILSKKAIQEFEQKWASLDSRLGICPGKTVLRRLREVVQTELSVNLTDIQIIDEFNISEIPNDMKELVAKLEDFRSSSK